MVIAAPSDENECRQLLYTCFTHKGPSAVRYPRGTGTGAAIVTAMNALPIGKGLVKREGSDVAILCFGTLCKTAHQVAENVGATLCDMRFVKPLDTALIDDMATRHRLLVTLEENAIAGGAGSAVAEHLAASGQIVPLLQLGLADVFVNHANQADQLAGQGLDAPGIERAINTRLAQLPEPATGRLAP